MNKEKTIYVFADFLPFHNELIGTIYLSQIRGKEFCSFEYDHNWLQNQNMVLDPDLQLYSGRQFITDEKIIFGVFADSCPDRWGRRLMNRREELRARERQEKPKKLLESDYLLGVYDESRMGALRFKTDLDGDFLSNDEEFATPPWTSLRELEQASLAFEADSNPLDTKWLKQLLAPGSSLGGARPKASVLAPDGSLWIAKFPSKHDDFNSGAWEMVVHDLAMLCKLNVPEAKAENFSKLGTTFLVKRFDRIDDQRIHFSSAMTMLGKTDGASAADGSSYLEIASFLKANGGTPKKDLIELWKRIVFSMAVSNTDDHFRNHGFLLTNNGWELSPLYDVNPDIYGEYLSLNVNKNESSIDFDLALRSARYYGVNESEASAFISTIKNTVKNNWESLAKKYRISRNEIIRMAPAFQICNN
ncbi:putative DNA-binding transcriptional regulator [[Ruminococcus] torques]|uniref:Putative DNA-binding transcriptional regulator n=1 Tax=[Ruminococcus] torques TaxID=33039 RepID=A0A564SEY5_9FIRM|nr:type II toxin-antitoxin system HipA family toxin [[Ruminococcus] torques]MBD9338114.1 type II toxin-antitoxin system HipA family toxin [Mediterraneibacter faecis]VUW93649.1 putative DNA-binding transcriptional regulator [[Ruminococcus] torques]